MLNNNLIISYSQNGIRSPLIGGKQVNVMNKRILVVDDDALILDMVEHCLEENGCAVTTADNGDEALDLLNIRNFDLVLCDIHMDGKDGFAVLAACKTLHPQTKIILCSGDVVYATLSRAFACGADSFLAKPFLFSELLRQVTKCLTPEQPRTRAIMPMANRRSTDFRPGRQL